MRFLLFTAFMAGLVMLGYNKYSYGHFIVDDAMKEAHACENDPALMNTRKCIKMRMGDDVVIMTQQDSQTINEYVRGYANAQYAGTYEIPISNGYTATVKLTRTNPRYCPRRRGTIYDIRSEMIGEYVIVND